jgi:hypothetical protein
MVLGSNIGLEDTYTLAVYGLVGRFAYGNLCVEKLIVWLERVWSPVLGYLLEVFYLTKGWMGFFCNTPEDVASLLEKNSVNGASSLMLKRRRVAFNLVTEYFSFRHFCVLLSGLPLYLWNEGVLAAIGDSLGKFIMIDKENLSAATRKVGRVLVEMDMHLGLSKTLEIDWRGKSLLQRLDYLGIVFRGIYCRSTSHLRRDCKGFGDGDSAQEGSDLLYNTPDSSMETSFYSYEDAHQDWFDPIYLESSSSVTGKL